MRYRLTRRRAALVLIALVCALVVPATMVGAAAQRIVGPAGSGATYEGTGAWFAELSGSPALFRSQAKEAGLKYTERFAFSKLWNGVSVRVSADQVDELEGVASVRNVFPVLEVPAPEMTPVAEPELITAIGMTGADIAQTDLGFTGAGVKVAVMDTGVDYDNPALGGCFGSGCRVATGFDFVGDAYDAAGSGAALVPNPDPDPDDCGGHGSHVAGIVGANGDVNGETVRGVAPGVTFGAYRVFGCVGSTESDIMVAAMERALADDMDVLNMSIGASFQTWPQYPTAVASDALVDAGMVVVASIGNSGANGVLSAGAPGVGAKVIGVAAFDNVKATLNFATAQSGGATIDVGYIPASAAPAPPTSGTLPIVKANAVGVVPTGPLPLAGPLPAADGCTPVATGTYSGKAVLVRRGTCSFFQKALIAQNGSASAVVLYNNNLPNVGFFSATVAGAPPITIPVVGTSDQLGVQLHNMIATGETTFTWLPGAATVDNPTAGQISSFSSYGLAADLSLKPDIGAPGGLIRSTLPLEQGGAGINSGTSMSSPHVAGAVALLKEARPNLAPGLFRDVLQNSADPQTLAINGVFQMGNLEYVHRQGAGMLDIDDAILSGTTISPGKLSLGESQSGPVTRTLTLRNGTSASQTFNLSAELAAATQPPAVVTPTSVHPFVFTATGGAGTASVSFSSSSVTVPAGGSATVNVTVAPNPALRDLSQYGGYVKFTPVGGGQVYRVPFAGLEGDYQSAVAMRTVDLTPFFGVPGFQFPAIGQDFGGGSFDIFPIGVGGTWTLANANQIPNVLLHFSYQSRRIEIEVVKASNGQKLHPVFSNMHEEEFLPRNSTVTGFFAFAWNGTRLHSNGNKPKTKQVPDGQYKLVVKVLKALGDPGNPAHWETWTSPTITIDRP